MLDLDNFHSIVDDIWATATQQTELPAKWTDFFDLHGPAPLEFNSQRRYHRFYLREKVIVIGGDLWLGGYTKDVSRIGMGIYTPVQLLPRQMIRVWLPSGRDYSMRVSRCQRIGDKCYECGANFVRVTEPAPNGTSEPDSIESFLSNMPGEPTTGTSE